MRSGAVPSPLTEPPPAARRVLVVDDQPDLSEALAAVLSGSGLGLRVRTATCAREALAMAKVESFDVALVDVKLPDASGVDLIRDLRVLVPWGEVVLVTGNATVDAAIGALRSGAFAFVLKSFRPEELLGVVEQALAKVQLRREREELERRYRDLVELTDMLIVGLDAKGRVAFINAHALSLLGRSQEEVVGTSFGESWMSEADRASLASAIGRLRGKRPEVSELETSFGHADVPALRKRRVRWHLAASSDDDRFVYVLGIDVTERRALEKRAADAEAMSAMGRIAMNLAHEIRNPLNAALLQLRLLVGRDLERIECDEETKGRLRDRGRIVGDEIGRLNQLLTEFLELARPRGLLRLPVDVGDLVSGVIELHREALDAKGIVVVREIDHVMASVDAEKLRRAVVNLVVNAVEAMREGDRLSVAVTANGPAVHVTVADTGPGMEASVLESAFDPFFTTKEAGTGLGLAIVRRVVDQHDGDVVVRSTAAEGTSVTIRLPLAATGG